MNTHQLHTLADRIARQERITHSQACALLARRGRGKSRGGNYGRTTVGPSQANSINSNVEKPAAVYWWQKDNA